MAGYANRIVTLHFPEFSEEGDDVHIVMRNPKTVPADEMRSAAPEVAKALAAEGDDAVDDTTAERAGYALMAKLIIGWHVYDATSAEEDQPLLPLPATPALVARLPMEILMRLTQELAKVNPQALSANLAASTSKTS